MSNELDRRRFLKVVSGSSLILFSGLTFSTEPARAANPTQADAIARICDLAAASDIASYDWKKRGKAPLGYIKGIAVSYAKTYSEFQSGNPNAIEMAKGMSVDPSKDALKHYEQIFQQANFDNSKAGVETLRHLFVLMLGLGMRESSGRYCEGRDRSAENTTAETAEAGLFQTSYNARHANALMPILFNDFSAHPSPSYLEIFKEGVRAKDSDLENYGDGEGQAFQKLSKECPFFALQFAAIGLRNIRKHWGPINRHDAEVKPDADALFKQVEMLVDQNKLGSLL